MKLAKLYDGTHLAFPPETPDAEMHAKVKEHTARLQSAAQTPSAAIEPSGQSEEQEQATPDVSGFLSMLQAVMEDRDAKDARSRAKEDEDRDYRDHKKQSAADMLEAVGGAANTVSTSIMEGLQPLVGSVDKLAENADKIDAVVKAIDKLSKTISTSVQLLVETMRMPKEIGFDANGKPKSLKIK